MLQKAVFRVFGGILRTMLCMVMFGFVSFNAVAMGDWATVDDYPDIEDISMYGYCPRFYRNESLSPIASEDDADATWGEFCRTSQHYLTGGACVLDDVVRVSESGNNYIVPPLYVCGFDESEIVNFCDDQADCAHNIIKADYNNDVPEFSGWMCWVNGKEIHATVTEGWDPGVVLSATRVPASSAAILDEYSDNGFICFPANKIERVLTPFSTVSNVLYYKDQNKIGFMSRRKESEDGVFARGAIEVYETLMAETHMFAALGSTKHGISIDWWSDPTQELGNLLSNNLWGKHKYRLVNDVDDPHPISPKFYLFMGPKITVKCNDEIVDTVFPSVQATPKAFLGLIVEIDQDILRACGLIDDNGELDEDAVLSAEIACRKKQTGGEYGEWIVKPVTAEERDAFDFCAALPRSDSDAVAASSFLCDEWECEIRRQYNVIMEQPGADDISSASADDELCQEKLTTYMSSTGLTWEGLFGTGSGECRIGTTSGGDTQYEIDHVCVYDDEVTNGEDCEPAPGDTTGKCKNQAHGCRYVEGPDDIIPIDTTGDKHIYVKVKEYKIKYNFGKNNEGQCATEDGCPKKYSNLLNALSVAAPQPNNENAYDFSNWCLYYENCEDPEYDTSAEEKKGFECTSADNQGNYTSDFSFEPASDANQCDIDAYAVFTPIPHYICYKDGPEVGPAAPAAYYEDPCHFGKGTECEHDPTKIGNCGDYTTTVVNTTPDWTRIYDAEHHVTLPTPTTPALDTDGLGWKFKGWVKADHNERTGWPVDCSKSKITKTDGIYNDEHYLVLAACWEKLMGSVKFICGESTSYIETAQVGEVVPWDPQHKCGSDPKWSCSSQDNEFEIVVESGVKLGSEKLVICRPSYDIVYHNTIYNVEEEIKINGEKLTPSIHKLGTEAVYPSVTDMNKNLSLLNVKPGYVFTGWRYNSPTSLNEAKSRPFYITGTAHVYASWEPVKHTINFNRNGGTGAAMAPMKDVTVEDTTTKLTKNTFTKARSSFLGWCRSPKCGADETMIEDEAYVAGLLSDPNNTTLTLYAQWEPISYAVVFDGCGNGSYISGPEPENITTNTNKTDTLPSNDGFGRPGYNFAGWCLANSEATDCANDSVFSAGDATNGLVNWNNIDNSPGVTIDGETNAITVTVCPKWEDKGIITCDPGYYLPYKLEEGDHKPRNDECQKCTEADIDKENVWCPGVSYEWDDDDDEDEYNNDTGNGGVKDCYGNKSEDLTECIPSYTVVFKKCGVVGTSPGNISTYLGGGEVLPENTLTPPIGHEFDAYCLADNGNGASRKCVQVNDNRFETGSPTDDLIDWENLDSYIEATGVKIDASDKKIEIRVCPIWTPKTFVCAAGEYFPYFDPSDSTKRNTECRVCKDVVDLDGKYCPGVSYTWADDDVAADFDDGSDQCPDGYTKSDGDRDSESSCYKEVQKQCDEIVPCPDHATCTWGTQGTVTARQYYGNDSLVDSEDACEMTFDCHDNYHKDEDNKQCLPEYTVAFKKCGTNVTAQPADIETYLGGGEVLPENTLTPPIGYEFAAYCLADNGNGASRKCVPGSDSFIVGSSTDDLIDWGHLSDYTPQTGVVINIEGAITINVCPIWEPLQYEINYYNYKNETMVEDASVWSETVNYTIEDYGTGSTKHPISLETPDAVHGYDFKGWCVYKEKPDENVDVEVLSSCPNSMHESNPIFELGYDEDHPENSIGNRWAYAMWTPKKIQCSEGHYIEAGSENCDAECPANSYCPGDDCEADDPDCGTEYDEDLAQGATECPAKYPYSDGGSDAADVTACYANCPEDTHHRNTAGRIYSPVVLGGDPDNQCVYEFVCPSTGKWLHIGNETLCLDRYFSSNTGPALVVAFKRNTGSGIKKYYARLSEDENMTINKESTTKLRINVGTKIYNVYDASFDAEPSFDPGS